MNEAVTLPNHWRGSRLPDVKSWCSHAMWSLDGAGNSGLPSTWCMWWRFIDSLYVIVDETLALDDFVRAHHPVSSRATTCVMLRRRGINRLTMSFEGAKSESHILRADGAHLGRVRCRLWRWTIDKTVEFNYKISSRLNFFFTLEISVYCRSLRKCLKYKKKLRAVFYCIATEARRRSVKQTHMFPPWKKD